MGDREKCSGMNGIANLIHANENTRLQQLDRNEALALEDEEALLCFAVDGWVPGLADHVHA